MTEERYQALQPFSGHLYTAAYCSFIRLTDSGARAVLDKLYTDEFGASGNILGGCNRCVLNALAKLGKAYFAYEKEREVEKEPEPILEIIENKPVTKPKQKRAVTKSKTVKKS